MTARALPLPASPTAREPRGDTRFLRSPSEIDPRGWRELAALLPDCTPFVDDIWIDSWIHAFRPAEPMLVGRWSEGRLAALAPMHRVRETWAGWSVAVLKSLTHLETPRFEFLSSGDEADLEDLWRAMCGDPQWDVIRLEALPTESPTLRAALKVADELGWHRVVIEHHPSPWKALGADTADWDQGLSRKFKSNLRNRERRLQALGEVRFEIARPTPATLETFYRLEASGWKGALGTAIAQRPAVRTFYDRVIERAGPGMWLPLLYVGDRPVAAQLIAVAARTLFLLKTAYDPDFAVYAPGQLLTSRLIQHGIAHEMRTLDFLGDPMTWKADWAPELRPHCQLLLFAPSGVGRYAYWTRYGVQEHAKQVPGLLRLVRGIRAVWNGRVASDSRLSDGS
jgi:CelD/BcsL family acetyltransferase involved in cellulose biosynthesis